MYLTTYVTEMKEDNYLGIYMFEVSCSLSLPLLNISKFEFINYLFGNLLGPMLTILLG